MRDCALCAALSLQPPGREQLRVGFPRRFAPRNASEPGMTAGERPALSHCRTAVSETMHSVIEKEIFVIQF